MTCFLCRAAAPFQLLPCLPAVQVKNRHRTAGLAACWIERGRRRRDMVEEDLPFNNNPPVNWSAATTTTTAKNSIRVRPNPPAFPFSPLFLFDVCVPVWRVLKIIIPNYEHPRQVVTTKVSQQEELLVKLSYVWLVANDAPLYMISPRMLCVLWNMNMNHLRQCWKGDIYLIRFVCPTEWGITLKTTWIQNEGKG